MVLHFVALKLLMLMLATFMIISFTQFSQKVPVFAEVGKTIANLFEKINLKA